MKKYQKISLAIGLALTILNAFKLPVSAQQTQTATQDQELELECRVSVTGPYGQGTSRCWVKGSQEQTISQEQVIVYREGERTVIKEHVPVNAALDTKTQLAGLSIMAVGSLAAVIKNKAKAK